MSGERRSGWRWRSLRREHRPIRTPDEIALQNAEEALRARPQEGRRRRKRDLASAAVAVVFGVAGTAVGLLVIFGGESTPSTRSGGVIGLGSGEARVVTKTFVDEDGRVCMTVTGPAGGLTRRNVGAKCVAPASLADRLAMYPAFATGLIVERRSAVVYGYAQSSLKKVLVRPYWTSEARVAAAWRPDASRYPRLALKTFVIRINFREGERYAPSGRLLIAKLVPNVFGVTEIGKTRVRIHSDLLKPPDA
jgi:hypothetical protein